MRCTVAVTGLLYICGGGSFKLLVFPLPKIQAQLVITFPTVLFLIIAGSPGQTRAVISNPAFNKLSKIIVAEAVSLHTPFETISLVFFG